MKSVPLVPGPNISIGGANAWIDLAIPGVAGPPALPSQLMQNNSVKDVRSNKLRPMFFLPGLKFSFKVNCVLKDIVSNNVVIKKTIQKCHSPVRSVIFMESCDCMAP